MDFAKYADLSEAQKAEFLELAEILVACSTKGRNEGAFGTRRVCGDTQNGYEGQAFLEEIADLCC